MDAEDRPAWTFLSNYGHVLIAIAGDTDIRMREIAETVGITERAAQGIVGALVEAGYVTKERVGRRNHYRVHLDLPLRHPNEAAHTVGDLLAGLVDDDG